MDVLGTALSLSIINTKIVDYIKVIFGGLIKDINPNWWMLVSLLTGAAIGWFADINLLSDVVVNALLGRILTAVAIGGGASLIHDVFGK